MTMTTSRAAQVKAIFLAWLATLGFDFFLHGGLLAGLYATPSPFLLAPERAFALIPLGYLSFLLLAILLVWLMARLNIRGGREGAFLGLQLGLLAWGALVLGLASIATAGWRLLLAWFLGQTVELTLAGLVAGSSLARQRQRPLVVAVLALVVVAVAATVVMQNLGLAPAPEIR